MQTRQFVLLLAIVVLPGGCPAGSDDDTGGDDDAAGPVQADGADYLWDVYTAAFSEPFEGGMVQDMLGGEANLVIHVREIDDDQGEIGAFTGMTSMSMDGAHQDLCHVTVALDEPFPGSWQPPGFEFGPIDAKLELFDGNLLLLAAFLLDGKTLTGNFTQEGDAIEDGTIEGLVDARYFDESVDPEGGEGVACEAFTALGIDCTECPDGSGPYCFQVSAHSILGEKVEVRGSDPETGEEYDSLVEVTRAQVDAWTAAGYCP